MESSILTAASRKLPAAPRRGSRGARGTLGLLALFAGIALLAPTSAVSAAPPGKPSDPSVDPLSLTSVSVRTFVSPNIDPPVTDVDVRYRASGTVTWSDHPFTLPDPLPTQYPTTTITGLTSNTTYEVQVRLENADGEGPWSNPVEVTPAARTPPPMFVYSITRTTATLYLAYPANWWYLGSQVGASCTKVYALGEAPLSGLTAGTSYTYKAYSDNGCTTELASTTFRTAYATAPATPTGVSATPDNLRVTLRWSAAARATGYQYQQKQAGGTCGTDGYGDWTSAGSGTSHVVAAGLTNGTRYCFRVRATNGAGESAASAAADATPPLPVPPKPTYLRAAALSPTSVSVRTFVSGNHHPPVTGVNVRYRARGTVTWSDHSFADPPWGTHYPDITITGLTSGTAYEVQVRLENANGEGPWSDSVEVTPAALTPPTLSSYSITQTTADLRLSYPASWWYRGSQAGASCTKVNWNTRVTLSGLTAGTSYTYRAYSDSGCTTELASVTFRTANAGAPWTPTGVSAERLYSQTTDLRWEMVPGATGYQYQQKRTSGTCGTDGYGDWASAGTGTSHRVTDLDTNARYCFRVRATNQAGESGASTAVSPPAIPEFLSPARADRQATLRWRAAAGATGYRIRYAESRNRGCPRSGWSNWASAGTGTSHTLTGLDNRKMYCVRLQATNPDGSTVAREFLESALPSKPTSVDAKSYSSTSLLLRAFVSPKHSPPVTGVDARYRARGTVTWSIHSFTDAPWGTQYPVTVITGLTSNTVYEVQVRFGNALGEGRWSDSVEVEVPAQSTPVLSAHVISHSTVLLSQQIPFVQDWWVRGSQAGARCEKVPATSIVGAYLERLTAGTSYTYRAYSDSGCTTELASVSFRTLSEPPTLTASALTQTTATLALNHYGGWRPYFRQFAPPPPPPHTDGGYGGCYPLSNANGNLRRLTADTEYTFKAYANNYCTTELASVSFRTLADGVPLTPTTTGPAKPAGLAAAAGDGQVVLTWTAMSGTTGWEVRQRIFDTTRASDDWNAWSVIDGSDATTARHVVTDLANGVLAGFQVRAWSGTGAGKTYGPESEETRARPVSATGSLPTAPAGLTAEGRDGDVFLSWTPNYTARRWEYQQREGGGAFGDWTPMDGSSMVTLAYIVGGLANGTEYGFRVRAVNARGEGPESAVVRATPAAPVGGPAKPEVTAEARGDGVRLGWAALPAAAGWEYRFKVGSGGWGRWRGTGVASPGTATGYDVTGLTAVGVAHGFQVRAFSGTGADKRYGAASDAVYATPYRGVSSGPVTVTLAAGPDWTSEGRVSEGGVATIRATRTGSTEGALSLPVKVNPRVETNPAEAGDYDARDWYSIDFAHGEAEATLDIATYADADGDDERFNVWMARYALPSGVVPGDPHHVYVTIEDPDEPAGTPAAPDAVDAASIGVIHNGTSLSVSWGAPARATHYDVTYYRGNWAHARAAWSRAGTSLTVTCDSRYPGQNRDCVSADGAYTVGLRARNVGGESAWVYSLQPAVAARSLSVADATAAEGPSATLEFAVTLSPAAQATVTVDYATADGTAAAGSDYTAASGTLTFAAGETTKTVSVAVVDDAHDEGSETLTLALSNASGASISDAEATGTITNADPLQRDWLARFGRAAAADAVAAVTARLETPRGAGSHLTVGGQRLPFGDAGASLPPDPAGGPGGASWPSWSGPTGDDPFGNPSGDVERTMSARELLMGTSFRAVLGTDPGVQWTGWGQGASVSGFSGATPSLSLSGEMATGSMGMDYERGDLLAGFAMTHSLGEGTAHGSGRSYAMGSAVTTLVPYVRYALSERVSAWGLAGSGAGRLTLELDGGVPQRHGTDLAMTLAAAGVRGELVTPDEAGGFALALKADAFWVRTESESVSTPGVGNLAGARADASRVRAVLDGSRSFSLAGGATLTPSVELGLRHDGGDAETGTGVELGAGVGWADPSRGLDMTLRVHGLAAHGEDDYGEWGVSGSLSLVPGAAGRGLSASLTPSYGADPGGEDRLWTLPDASGLTANEDAQGSSRLDGEVGFGLPVFGGGFTGTPNVGFGLSDTAREVRMGWRLTPARGGDFELGLDLTRRDSGGDAGAEHGVGLTLNTRF